MTRTSETALVFGATGTQGGPVARALLDAGYAVRAVGRRPGPARALTERGADVVPVDLDDLGSVSRAAEGVDRVFLHLPLSWRGSPDPVLGALADAGVRQIVFSTSGPVPDQPMGIAGLDERVEFVGRVLDTGIATVLKPTGFMENLSTPWSAQLIAAGELAYPRPPEFRTAWITNDDVGAFTAAAFGQRAAIGQLYKIAGPEVLDGPETAERLSRALGRPITYREITGSEFAEMMAPYLGAETAGAIGAGYDRMPREQNPLVTTDVRPAAEALGVEPTPLEEWARRQRWDPGPAR